MNLNIPEFLLIVLSSTLNALPIVLTGACLYFLVKIKKKLDRLFPEDHENTSASHTSQGRP